jgi:hypothetical protein
MDGNWSGSGSKTLVTFQYQTCFFSEPLHMYSMCGDPRLLHLFLKILATSPRVAYTTKFRAMSMKHKKKAKILN